jgi:hypothetical protein
MYYKQTDRTTKKKKEKRRKYVVVVVVIVGITLQFDMLSSKIIDLPSLEQRRVS